MACRRLRGGLAPIPRADRASKCAKPSSGTWQCDRAVRLCPEGRSRNLRETMLAVQGARIDAFMEALGIVNSLS